MTSARVRTDDIPTLPAYRTADGSQLRVWCDYCPARSNSRRRGCWHYHGCGPEFGSGDGHRVAHCWVADSPYRQTGYILREVAEAARRVATPDLAADKPIVGRRGCMETESASLVYGFLAGWLPPSNAHHYL